MFDISFWLPENSSLSKNDVHELIRDLGNDWVEQVHIFDEFTHPKTGRKSQSYKVIYRHLERTLTKAEVNKVHQKIQLALTSKFGVTIR